MSDLDYRVISDLLRREEEKRRALSVLLGEHRTKAGRHLAVQAYMGGIPSYITSVPLRWVADKVGFAADLPIFRESIEGSRRMAADRETLEAVRQRQPDWRRQQQMSAYLATRLHHKFPPLLLVSHQRWVSDVDNDKWAPADMAMNDSLTLTGLEPTGTYWDLDDSDTLFYALDGQHRLMAILGLQVLVRDGHLPAFDENRRHRNQPPLSRDDIITRIQERGGGEKNAIHERLQHLMDESIGIEIVPAVIMGESISVALRRVRQLFVDVQQAGQVPRQQ